MQRVDLEFYEGPVHCPFCGRKTYGVGKGSISRCKHTLFAATDEGLEYCSRKVKRNVLEKRAERDGWDKATDKFAHPKSVKFALYAPPPAFMGLYIGYAPE